MPREAWFIYNKRRSIKVDRDKMARACPFLERLLEGPFKESKQYNINFSIGHEVPFEAFDCVIRYANDGVFQRDPELFDIHISAIELAILWDYRDFIELVETHFVENITLDTLIPFSNLSRCFRYHLEYLYQACEEYADTLNKFERPMRWPRCSFDHHQKHHLLNCPGQEREQETDLDWDQLADDKLYSLMD